MTITVGRTLFAVLLFVASADAAEPSGAESLIAPGQVTLGMTLAALKAVRPNAFDGPEASRPNDPQQRKWPTMMEVIDLGQPSQISYWYLFSDNKLTGLLRTRNLVLVPYEGKIAEASFSYAALAGLLGAPRGESLLRKGDSAFVNVAADVWTAGDARRSFYFIATTKEITSAVFESSDFPIEQVFIRPDPNRFEVEDDAAKTLTDLPRPQPIIKEVTPDIQAPAISFPSLPEQKYAATTSPVNSMKKCQPNNITNSFEPWMLVILIALGTSWLAWRSSSKSQRNKSK